MTGIYKITCDVTGEVYIGQSTAIARRWATHRRELKNNQHYNQHLQRAYNKYGEEHFQYEILEQCPKTKLNEREEFYIKIFDSYNNGFNQDVGGCNIRGENNPMYGKNGINSPRFKDYILQIDLEGNIIEKYESTIAAAKAVNGQTAHILGCLKTWNGFYYERPRFTHKNYQWIYEKDYHKFKKYHDFSKKLTSKKLKALQQVNEGTLNSDI